MKLRSVITDNELWSEADKEVFVSEG